MKLNTAPPRALVVHCGDPRFQPAFADFKANKLGLQEGEYIPLVVPGSVGALTVQTFMPKNFKIISEQLELLMRNYPTARVVFIFHEGCKSYAHVLEKLRAVLPRVNVNEKQVQDLRLAASLFRQLVKRFGPQFNLELYMARIGPDNEIIFEKIEEGGAR